MTDQANGRRIGYISGATLSDIQNQWAELIDVEVDMILFDKHVLKDGFNPTTREFKSPKIREITDYMDTMMASQDMLGSSGYYELNDLQPNDTIVLTDLRILKNSDDDTLDKIINLWENGTHLVVTSKGFCSSGEGGDLVMSMLSEIRELCKS